MRIGDGPSLNLKLGRPRRLRERECGKQKEEHEGKYDLPDCHLILDLLSKKCWCRTLGYVGGSDRRRVNCHNILFCFSSKMYSPASTFQKPVNSHRPTDNLLNRGTGSADSTTS